MDGWIMRAITVILGAALIGSLVVIVYCKMHSLPVPTEVIVMASSISGGFLGVITGQKLS